MRTAIAIAVCVLACCRQARAVDDPPPSWDDHRAGVESTGAENEATFSQGNREVGGEPTPEPLYEEGRFHNRSASPWDAEDDGPAALIDGDSAAAAEEESLESSDADLGNFDLLDPATSGLPQTHPRRLRGAPRYLQGESWLNRPWSVSFFTGGMFGDELIPGAVDQTSGFFGGIRGGWDFDMHWGLETRLGYASMGLRTTPPAAGTDRSRTGIWDLDLLYYPWGDRQRRPYFLVGFGVSDILYFDANRVKLHETLFGIPFGGGIKWRWSDRLVLRLEVLDNLALAANKTSTVHNVSLTGGIELRLGGRRRSYWPWQPSSLAW